MKTTRPTTFNYRAQYALMAVAPTVLRMMPPFIVRAINATTTQRMMRAEQQAYSMHVDRYDMISDWGCLMERIAKQVTR